MGYIGIDGGGTKTKFTYFDETLEEISSITLKTCHIGQVSDEEFISIIREGIDHFSFDKNPVICASVAGFGVVKAYKERITNIFKTHFSHYKYTIMSDIQSAYLGALGVSNGIVVICGTGSIGISYNNGKFTRVGGYGPTFSDEGSAYFIGKLLVSEFFKQSDGRHKKTLLYTYIKEHFNISDDYDLLKILNNDREKIAKFCILCYNLVKQGDEIAFSIFEQASLQLLEIITTLNNTFNSMPTQVSFIGGVTKSFDILLPLIKANAPKNLSFVKPKNSPEYGAVLAYRKGVKM